MDYQGTPWDIFNLRHSSLKEVPRPAWLVKDAFNAALPTIELLKDSVFYPGSGTDGNPIDHLKQYFWSFVFADYGYSPGSIREALGEDKFGRDYKLLGHRAITEEELPLAQWSSETNGQFAYGLSHEDNAFKRGDCPFGEWALLEDRKSRPKKIISLLFFGADGIALLQKLYVERGIAPACVCIIQAPPAMGGFNWTNFEDERSPLFRSLQENSAGLPRFLLNGGSGDPERYKKPCWSMYSLRLAWPLMRMRNWERNGALSLWEQQPETRA